MSSNQVLSVRAGSMRLLHAWNHSTGKKSSLNGCRLETDHGCDPRVVLEGVCPCRTCSLRRLRLPLPLSPHAGGCGLPVDSFGHHRASCTRALGGGDSTRKCCGARVQGGRRTGDHKRDGP